MYELLKLVLVDACLERTDCCREREVVMGKQEEECSAVIWQCLKLSYMS